MLLKVGGKRAALEQPIPDVQALCVVHEQQLRVLFQPFKAQASIDDFAAGRGVFQSPGEVLREFQLTMTKEAVFHASLFTELAEDDAVLSGTPRVGRALSCRSFDDTFDCSIFKGIDFIL